jgi:hypothetical protein
LNRKERRKLKSLSRKAGMWSYSIQDATDASKDPMTGRLKARSLGHCMTTVWSLLKPGKWILSFTSKDGYMWRRTLQKHEPSPLAK